MVPPATSTNATIQKNSPKTMPRVPEKAKEIQQAGMRAPVNDVTSFGDEWLKLSETVSTSRGYNTVTLAKEIVGMGTLINVNTQRRNGDGTWSLAEAVTFVPGVKIMQDAEAGKVVRRYLQHI